jgi:hypothetical protein
MEAFPEIKLKDFKDIFLSQKEKNDSLEQDIKDAFLTIELDDESKDLTIFSTPWGLYRYKRLNMGLCVASELFQETLTQKLAGLRNIKVAMDDILVFGKTKLEHDEALEALLKRLVELN